MSSTNHLWPYVLLLPESNVRRPEFIRRVLASKVAPAVLSRFDREGRAFQKDLVSELSHSNRSILIYLKALQEFGLVETDSLVEKGKRVVVHTLTRSGWGLARFFSEGIPSDFRELTEYLLEDYLLNLINLYREKGLEASVLFDTFSRTRARSMLQSSPTYANPDFMLFGAAAFFTQIECPKLPDLGDEVGCKSPIRYVDGPTVRLALALAREGHDVSFSSSVGNDQDGWTIISELIEKGIDVSHIVINEEMSTNQTIIVDVDGNQRILVGIGDKSALSLTSPSQVSWDTIKEAKVIYLGEVFLEVAVSIAAFAQSFDIPVAYRCSPHYWRRGLQELKPVLSQIDFLLLSLEEWQEAKRTLGSSSMKTLRNITGATIIARTSSTTYKVVLPESSTATEYHTAFHSEEISLPFTIALLEAASERRSIDDALDAAIKMEASRLKDV